MFRPPARLVRKKQVRVSETLGEVISSDYRSADYYRHKRFRLRPHQRLLPRRPGRSGVRQVHRRRGEGRRPGTGRVLPRGPKAGRREGPEGQEPVGPPVEANRIPKGRAGASTLRPYFLPLFTRVRGIGILGSSYTTLRISDSKSSRISSKRLLHDAYKACIKLIRA